MNHGEVTGKGKDKGGAGGTGGSVVHRSPGTPRRRTRGPLRRDRLPALKGVLRLLEGGTVDFRQAGGHREFSGTPNSSRHSSVWAAAAQMPITRGPGSTSEAALRGLPAGQPGSITLEERPFTEVGLGNDLNGDSLQTHLTSLHLRPPPPPAQILSDRRSPS